MAGTVKLSGNLNRVRERLNKNGTLTTMGVGNPKVTQQETKVEKKARLLKELSELE